MDDGWPPYDEYWQRVSTLRNDGLDVRLQYHNDEGFISLTVEILEGVRLRSITPWRLHITICYSNEVEPSLLEQIAGKWHNSETHLNVSRCGSGGTAILGKCSLSECPLIELAHRSGWYKDRELHISF